MRRPQKAHVAPSLFAECTACILLGDALKVSDGGMSRILKALLGVHFGCSPNTHYTLGTSGRDDDISIDQIRVIVIVVRQDNHPLDLFVNGKGADASVHGFGCGWRRRSILSALLLLSPLLVASRSSIDDFFLDTPGIDDGIASSSNEQSPVFSSPNHARNSANMIGRPNNGNIRGLGSQIMEADRPVLPPNREDEARGIGLPSQARHRRRPTPSTGGRAEGVGGISASKIPHLDASIHGPGREEDATAVELDVSHWQIVAGLANRPTDLGRSLPQLSSVG